MDTFNIYPDSKVHGANIGPTWVLSAPDGPHVGPMNFAIRAGMTWLPQSENLVQVHSWTKVYRIFFQRAVTSRWRGKSTICQFRNGDTSNFYKFVKCHRRRRNGHGPVPLNNEQRFKFAMSTYTRAAHHCDQRSVDLCFYGTQRESLWAKLTTGSIATAFTQINSISRNSEILHFDT